MDQNEMLNLTTESNFEEILQREYKVDASIPRDSPITQFYAGKTVLLTGTTGFLGHLLLEKLLRYVVHWNSSRKTLNFRVNIILFRIGVKRVYVLMRQKRNQDSKERLEKVFNGPVFQHLPKYDPNFRDRITIVAGDLSEQRLGIEDNAILNELKDNIEIVIHNAANVNFNETLYNQIWCNLVGTRDLLELSKQMTKLQVFVYMSTAFSNSRTDSSLHMEEKFYEPPMNADILIDYVQMHRDEADKELFNMIGPILIEPWRNSYTFTKALSESVVRRYGKDFPIAVIRPSISKLNHFH